MFSRFNSPGSNIAAKTIFSRAQWKLNNRCGRYYRHISSNQISLTFSSQGKYHRSFDSRSARGIRFEGFSEKLIFSMLVLGGFFVSTANAEEEVVVERSTMLEFPKREEEMVLVATASRCVTWFRFLTYAVGIYVEDNQQFVEEGKRVIKGKEEVLVGDDQFYQWFFDSSVEKIIKIIPYRDIDRKHLSNALDQGLFEVLDGEKEQVEATRNSFVNLFQEQNYKTGQHLDFVWKKDQFSMRVNGETSGSVNNPELGKAFFSIFMGKHSRTPEMNQRITSDLIEYLSKN